MAELHETAAETSPAAVPSRLAAASRSLLAWAIPGLALFAFAVVAARSISGVRRVMIVLVHPDTTKQFGPVDFTVFYTAATYVRTQSGDRLFNLGAFSGPEHGHNVFGLAHYTLPYLNPPFVALLLAPLSMLSFAAAFRVWSAANLLALIITCVFIWRAARHERWPMAAALVAVMIATPQVGFSLRLGQFSLILAGLWTSTFVALHAGRPRLAGLLLACCLIKPEVVIAALIWLAWTKQTAVLRPFLATAVVLAGLCFMAAGAAAVHYPAYVLGGVATHADPMSPNIFMGWDGLIASALRITSPSVATALAVPASLITLSAIPWATRRSNPQARLPAIWLLITIVTLLIDPHLYQQDLVMLTAPACMYLLATSGARRRLAWYALAVTLLILSLGIVPNAQWHLPLLPVWLVFCGAALAISLRRERQEARVLPIAPPGTTARDASIAA